MRNDFSFKSADRTAVLYPNINKSQDIFIFKTFPPFNLIKEIWNMKPLAADEMFEGIDIDDVRKIV